MNKITIIDAICGSGKTSWAIQKIKEPFSGRFIYVTPYLDEVARIKDSTDGDFKEPTNNNSEGSKVEGLRELITKGENIVCTHELFKICDREILDKIKEIGYTLILDEVLNVINQVNISRNDLSILSDTNTINVDEVSGCVKWNDESYTGKFDELKYLSKNDNLFLFNNTFLFWTLHDKTFEVFQNSFNFFIASPQTYIQFL